MKFYGKFSNQKVWFFNHAQFVYDWKIIPSLWICYSSAAAWSKNLYLVKIRNWIVFLGSTPNVNHCSLPLRFVLSGALPVWNSAETCPFEIQKVFSDSSCNTAFQGTCWFLRRLLHLLFFCVKLLFDEKCNHWKIFFLPKMTFWPGANWIWL